MIIHSPDYELHQDPYHIENKDRTKSIMQNLYDKNFLNHLNVSNPEKSSKKDLLRVHSPGHVNHIQEFCEKGGGYLDYDTYASPQSYQVALLAGGGAIMAAEKVILGEKWAYSVSRPPGHHAIRENAMGFCLFNNAAVAVEKIRDKYDKKRFLIFDFDVHYGNGDADIFYDDPEVMYVSIHQDPHTIFPGKGFLEEIGSGPGTGFNLNIPMHPGSNNADYIWILDKILPGVISEFKADLLLVEAGFDAHRDDPLSQINIDEDFYSWVGVYLMGLQESMAVILEGGYNLRALAQS
ncbi:MAG: histone deacetylase, partial [Methanobacterium sp.]|nr:histone deacetylase [Methanobacterium sp.]